MYSNNIRMKIYGNNCVDYYYPAHLKSRALRSHALVETTTFGNRRVVQLAVGFSSGAKFWTEIFE